MTDDTNAAICTIRTATREDLPRARDLLRRHGIVIPRELDAQCAGRHVLVLDEAGTLEAVAVLQIAAGHGHLIALAVEHANRALEERMVGVAEAMCAAFDADLDVGARAA